MDIRALYKSLSPEDRIIYQQIRSDFRKIYLNAHNNIVGMDKWSMDDDYFLDLLDIKIAEMFDRMGKVDSAVTVVDKEEKEVIEASIEKSGNKITEKMNTEMSAATASMKNKGGW